MRISKGWFIGLTIFFVVMILSGLVPTNGSTNITLSIVFLIAQIGITVWYFVGRTRPAPHGPSRFWKCQQCQTILIKGLPEELASLLGPEKMVGTATCTSCGATFSQGMVYSGYYDVPEVALNCPHCQTQLQGPSEMLLGKPCPSCQRTLPS